MNNFTTEDMIRFLYNEMSPEETAQLMAALETDFELREKFEVLQSAKNNLETLHYTPRKRTIENIMQYAEEPAAIKSH
jgi:hypothetical protein